MITTPRDDDHFLHGEAAVQNFTDEELAELMRDMFDRQLAAIGRLVISNLTDWLVGYEDEAVHDEVTAMNALLDIRNEQARLHESNYQAESQIRPDEATARGI